jgi:hypothetical protein
MAATCDFFLGFFFSCLGYVSSPFQSWVLSMNPPSPLSRYVTLPSQAGGVAIVMYYIVCLFTSK